MLVAEDAKMKHICIINLLNCLFTSPRTSQYPGKFKTETLDY